MCCKSYYWFYVLYKDVQIYLLFYYYYFLCLNMVVPSSLVAAYQLAGVRAGIDTFPDPVAHLRYVFCPQLEAVGFIRQSVSFVTPSCCRMLLQVRSDWTKKLTWVAACGAGRKPDLCLCFLSFFLLEERNNLICMTWIVQTVRGAMIIILEEFVLKFKAEVMIGSQFEFYSWLCLLVISRAGLFCLLCIGSQ